MQDYYNMNVLDVWDYQTEEAHPAQPDNQLVESLKPEASLPSAEDLVPKPALLVLAVMAFSEMY